MSKFTIRKECPVNNKFYNKTTDGGLNTCVYGYPVVKGCSTLADCTGYASGRFNEIISEIKGKDAWYYDLNSDAGSFIKYGVPMGLKVSQTPQPGSIMVWDVTGPGGHVCVVEEVISIDRVMISQSNWGGPAFEYKAKTNANGNWGMNKARFKFLGFLLNPAVEEEQDTSTDTEPETSGTYTVVRGDTMTKIAKAHGITLGELKRLNPQVKNANLIYPGQILNVPKNKSTSPESLKVGDLVRIQKDAPVYGRTYKFSAWVYRCSLYVRAIDGDKITVSTLKSGAITGNVDRKYLTKV